MNISDFSFDSSIDPEQPAIDLVETGRAKLFFGAVPHVASYDKVAANRSGLYIAEGYMGQTLPAGSVYLDPHSAPADWAVGDVPIYSTDYFGDPSFWPAGFPGTQIDRTMPGGAGSGHWVFRVDDLYFPPSATQYIIPLGSIGPHWGANVVTPDQPGENLYLYEIWLDNEGTVYLTDPVTDTMVAIGGYGGFGSDWGAYYRTSGILSCKPGSHTLVMDKRGDTAFDGLSIRLARIYNNGGLISVDSGWVLGSISIGDEVSGP